MSALTLPRSATVLGLAGVLPQAICLITVATEAEARWIALAAGCIYAALILSFLGGLWWMAGLLAGSRDPRVYIVAVMPSLAGWAVLLPWCLGWEWPLPALIWLAVLLAASPLVDRWLARSIAFPAGWLRLRVMMAGGLATLTLALAVAPALA